MRTEPAAILVGVMAGLPGALAAGPIGLLANAIGLGIGVALIETRVDVKVPRAIDNARRFCEGRDAKPGELALVRYHEDGPAC